MRKRDVVIGALRHVMTGVLGTGAAGGEEGVVVHKDAFVCPNCMDILPNMGALHKHHAHCCGAGAQPQRCASCNGTVEPNAPGSDDASCSARISGREVTFCGPHCWAGWLKQRGAIARDSHSAAARTAASPVSAPTPTGPPVLSASGGSFDGWYNSTFEEEMAEVHEAAAEKLSGGEEEAAAAAAAVAGPVKRAEAQQQDRRCPCDMCGSAVTTVEPSCQHSAKMMGRSFRFCSAQCWHSWATGGFVGCSSVFAMCSTDATQPWPTASASPAAQRQNSAATAVSAASEWGFYEDTADSNGTSPPTPTPTSGAGARCFRQEEEEELSQPAGDDIPSAGEARAVLARFGSFMGRLDGALAEAGENGDGTAATGAAVSSPRTSEARAAAFVEAAASDLAEEAGQDLGTAIAEAIAGIERIGTQNTKL